MELSASHFLQLAVALGGAVFVFALVYVLPEKFTIVALILSLPFQPIESRYGTLNMVLIYVVGLGLFLRHRLPRLPLLLPLVFVFLAYLVSLSQTPRNLYLIHGVYLTVMGANAILFYITYNFIRKTTDYRFFLRLVVGMNVLVLIYCAVQLFWGGERISLYDVEDLGLLENRADLRLMGPFHMVGATAEYMVLQTLLLAYLLMHIGKGWHRYGVYLLIMANLGFLVATANRGGFLSLIMGAVIFAFAFRRELGIARIIAGGVGGVIFLTVASFVVIHYTKYNIMYDRLSTTEVEGGVPDSRSKTWPLAWENIRERPIFGYGPRYRAEYVRTRSILDYITYPHNLYLFLLYTIGVVGLLAYTFFWGSIYWRLWKARRQDSGDPLLDGLPRLGLIVMTVFFIDQLKVEFLRHLISDYQQYIFMLMAMFLAFSDICTSKERIEWALGGSD